MPLSRMGASSHCPDSRRPDKESDTPAIALMPVASPARLQFRDGNLAPAFMSVATLRTDDEEERCATFRQRMGAARELLGAKLIANLLVDLNSAGFVTS